MSDRAEVKLTILEAMVKGYHECSFAVHVEDKFVVKQKRGGNEDTFSASSNYFVHTVNCCVRPDSVAVVFFKLSKRSFSDDGINLLKISPFGVIPSDIHIVNESISNQLNNKDFSSLKCVNISHTCSSS